MSDSLCDSMDCSPPGSSLHRILQARILEWVAIPFSRGSPDPGTEPGSPALQADSLKSEPPGKPLNFSVLSQGWGEGEWRRKKEGKGLEAKKKLDVI